MFGQPFVDVVLSGGIFAGSDGGDNDPIREDLDPSDNLPGGRDCLDGRSHVALAK
jgi:hypothetical protein